MLPHHLDGDARRRFLRITIHTGADAGKCDAPGALLQGPPEGIPVAIFQQCRLAQGAATPHRSRGMHHPAGLEVETRGDLGLDRKSTRLNSSHMSISYAVFCLKKKTKPARATRH